MSIGIYPGSFDPITLGHLDVIRRSSKLMDELIIGVLVNSAKSPLFTAEERVKLIEQVIEDLPNVKVEAFDGLTVDFAKKRNANIIIRGLRAVSDFEYELQIGQINHKLNPEIDTIFLTTSEAYSYLSSSIVKEVARYNGDISQLVPSAIVGSVHEKYQARRNS